MVYDFLVKKNQAAFLAKVSDISAQLGILPDWLMVIMKTESNLDPAAVNPYSGATGLIQFMPDTASSLGTSTSALKLMDNLTQLDYVYRYFAPYAGRIKSPTDLYVITFFPRALGKPDDYVLQTDTITAARIAGQNAPYDLNKNQEITAGELKMAFSKKIPSGVSIIFDQVADAAGELKKKLN